MDRSLRESLKRAIDAKRREQIENERTLFGGIYVCSGCGMNLFDRTPGCDVCSQRWSKWRRRHTGLATDREYDLADRMGDHWEDYRYDVRRQNGGRMAGINFAAGNTYTPPSYRRSMRHTIGRKGW